MINLGRRILWQRARDYLKRYQPTVVGITGSDGLTLVKLAVKLALEDTHHLRAAPFSYRRREGIALAILGATKDKVRSSWARLLIGSRIRELAEDEPSIIILELGSHQPSDIDYVVRKLSFQIGVVTNVQSANLDVFGNKDMVAHEQTSLITTLSSEGIACLNKDDRAVTEMAKHTKAHIVWFGEDAQADVRLVRVQRLSSLGQACQFNVKGRPIEIHLPHIIARQQLSSISAALAVVVALKGDVQHAARRLGRLKPPPGAGRLLSGKNNSRLLDWSYDATPENMLSNINTLEEINARRRITILGDIQNLGAAGIAWHDSIGERAAAVADIVVVVGEHMRRAGEVALTSKQADVHHFSDSRDVGKWIGDALKPSDVVLIAGSRDMHMEEVVYRLLANPARDQNRLVQS